MVTSKSTVLGLRLDHERRAWVEAEAARRGISVRALFEEFIDGAQGGELGAGTSAGLASDSSIRQVVNNPFPEDDASDTVLEHTPPVAGITAGAPRPSEAPSSPHSGAATPLPGRLIRGAFALPANLIKMTGRCALTRVENCPLTRPWVDR